MSRVIELRATPARERPSPVQDGQQVLTGWGRTTRSRCTVRADPTASEADVLGGTGDRGLTPRGLGRSYGDAALNTGGTVLDCSRRGRSMSLDTPTGILTADSGVSLAEVLRTSVPAGWVPPVLPGTAQVTLGGALAADVHGKNHTHAGSFSAHVLDAVLLTPAHGRLTISPTLNPELFWATAGGLGLTGVLLSLRVQLSPLAGPDIVEVSTRASDLATLLDQLHRAGARHEHTVAWIDGAARGRHLGRGVVSAADHAPATHDLRSPAVGNLSVPSWWDTRVVSAPAVRAANALRYATAGSAPTWRRRSLSSALHPLDRVPRWNRLYGPTGFIQHQLVVPRGAEDVLEQALHVVGRAGCTPSLVVLKSLGAASPGPLGFPLPGWTLAMDFPARSRGLARALHTVDAAVAEAGGRLYLVKDSRVRPDIAEWMYPALPAWRAVCREVDPHGVMTSDLDRRLHLRRGPRSAS